MSFADDLSAFRALATDRQNQVISVAAVEVFNSVSVGSPVTGSQGTAVVTGFAAGSWYVADGDAPAAGGGRVDTGAQLAELAGMQGGDLKSVIGGAVYLRRLEEGHQKQRPAGFVALTVANWERVVSHALRIVLGRSA